MSTNINRNEAINRTLLYLAETLDNGTVFSNETSPVDGFLDEAAVRVAKIAPLHMLGEGVEFNYTSTGDNENGVGYINLKERLTRLISIKLWEWNIPVTSVITESDPKYALQQHPATRGGKKHPVVALTQGGTRLELYSINGENQFEVQWFKGLSVTKVEDCPDTLLNPICWMAASLFLTSQGENDSATIAMNKSLELLQV